MPPRFSLLPAIFLAALLPSLPLHAGPALASSPVLTFFSSVDGGPFARIEATAVRPNHARHGPFRLPAPGLRLESPQLTLFDHVCTAEDWSRFLRNFAAWRRLSVADDFLVTLPDGRAFELIEVRQNSERHALLSLVAPLASPAAGEDAPARFLLRIGHDADGGRLAITLDPEPAPRAANAQP